LRREGLISGQRYVSLLGRPDVVDLSGWFARPASRICNQRLRCRGARIQAVLQVTCYQGIEAAISNTRLLSLRDPTSLTDQHGQTGTPLRADADVSLASPC